MISSAHLYGFVLSALLAACGGGDPTLAVWTDDPRTGDGSVITVIRFDLTSSIEPR